MKHFYQRAWSDVRENAFLYTSIFLCIMAMTYDGPKAIRLAFRAYDYWHEEARIEDARCDRVVGTLLTTKDSIEIQRAGIILQNTHCSVAKRLPE